MHRLGGCGEMPSTDRNDLFGGWATFMRIKSIFVAYPYDFGQEYRDALEAPFAGSGVELRYADDRLENAHVMDKIRRMMNQVDVCLFDVTGNNPNVMFELGYAYGAQEPGFVVVRNDSIDHLSADITGWDQLRYSGFSDLGKKVYERILNARVPLRPAVETRQLPQGRDSRDILRELRFGSPAVDAPVLCVYEIPSDYTRHYKPRSVLGKPPFRAQDLCDSVLAGPNLTHHPTFFWQMGFDYTHSPGPDFVEVYEGRSRGGQRERVTNFRVYTSGAAVYMQRLREGGAAHKPFLYLYMFEEIVEMALVAISDIRKRWDFTGQSNLAVGAVFLNASELRVSEATRDFYPIDDGGNELALPSDELWIPDTPLIVDSEDLYQRAKELSEEMTADLRTRIA